MDSLEALVTRSSAKTYGDTAPTKEHLATVLQAAVRAPDHGRLRPWRFMLIEGDQRKKFGEMLAASARRRIPGLSDGDLQRERREDEDAGQAAGGGEGHVAGDVAELGPAGGDEEDGDQGRDSAHDEERSGDALARGHQTVRNREGLGLSGLAHEPARDQQHQGRKGGEDVILLPRGKREEDQRQRGPDAQ